MLRNTGKFVKSREVEIVNDNEEDEDEDQVQKYQQKQQQQFKAAQDAGFAGRKDTRIQEVNDNIRVDNLYGFSRVNDLKERTGYLINMHATEIVDEEKRLISGVDYYFIEECGDRFKISMIYHPYFYILSEKGHESELSSYLLKKYNGTIIKVEIVDKEDLDLANHLSGLKQKFLKVYFSNLFDLQKVRKDVKKAVKKNLENKKSQNYYTELLTSNLGNNYNDFDEDFDDDDDDDNNRVKRKKVLDNMDNILDIREFDVPHHVRVSIDLDIYIGCWYTIKSRGDEKPIINRRKDLLETIEPVILAYDIETTKLPLKFPDALVDQIMMISYMIDGKGYLITNREIVGQDINDFEYTPKPEFPGLFKVFNEQTEKSLLKRFFNHIIEISPNIFVSYNGDFFDWPFVETRAEINGIEMFKIIGVRKNKDNIFTSRSAMHMDCLNWVKRDSYLPVGSQGLKAVTKAKLRYNPVEVDPENMCKLAREEPEILANYSVSDAVATYYLYLKYIHPFIFALCTIIPMEPDEVLRKGSGTLCESLLMVQAYHSNIVFPNKKENELNKFTNDGHLLDSETYVGGHVEALESGVFRADFPYHFKIVPSMIDKLINNIENTLNWTIKEEENVDLDLVDNLEELKAEIKDKLINLKEKPNRYEHPKIYHLDVGAMYPNIILTNRLQPSAMVNEKDCASCCYNDSNALCKRVMQWTWRGEYLPANMGEYQRIKQQLEMEKFPGLFPTLPKRSFNQLMEKEQAAVVKKRLNEFSKKTYKKGKITKVEIRDQTVCQRENSFYVDTVRAFRDRRYEYKGLTKVAKQQVNAAIASGDDVKIKSAKNLEILYDSLQLAHKCILNSFYGYVMRRGSRWFSMEMGGIVCHTGSAIITKAREIVEQIGRPLELDTDGIWCMLPNSFPDNFAIKTRHPKKSKIVISYPNAVLNYMVKQEFTNDVYHEQLSTVDENGKNEYKVKSENTIFFEVDGPYLAMVLPAAKEEGKKLKKRYAVFHFDGTIAELKGFEIKRRGELQLIKIFQSSVFECFLKGSTLSECYDAVAKIANDWLNILFNKGEGVSEEQLFELISENKSMSKKLQDYGQQKSTSISTAKRLAEFLGDQMVKDAGLACKYIISKKPEGAPVTERAIPVAIFQSEENVTLSYLRKWLKDSSLQDCNIKDILDWDYYIERLGSAIQKIITIPAEIQGISNPVPRVKHPDWLHKKLMDKSGHFKQRKMDEMFQVIRKEKPNENSEVEEIEDIEDGLSPSRSPSQRPVATIQRKRKISEVNDIDEGKNLSWREALGAPPAMGQTKAERQAWLDFHKQKWAYQAKQRGIRHRKRKRIETDDGEVVGRLVRNTTNRSTITGFFRKAQMKLLETPWQIIQIGETNEPGIFRLWVLVDQELHQLKLIVPRIFYINSRVERGEPGPNDLWRKRVKILPRSRPVYHLYEYTIPESFYQENNQSMIEIITQPENEGVYETKTPLIVRAIINLGCVCIVPRNITSKMLDNNDTFHLNQLMIKPSLANNYLNSNNMQFIYLYNHWSVNHQRSMWGLFLNPVKKCHIFIHDSVRTNQMPNMTNLYRTERDIAVEKYNCGLKCSEELNFDIKFETNLKAVYKGIQAALDDYKNKMKGGTILVIQSPLSNKVLLTNLTILNDFPVMNNNVQDLDNLYSTMEWQKIGSKYMLRHFFQLENNIESMINYSRFFEIPIGNICNDINIFGADISYARLLKQQNFVLWCSTGEYPDLGGHEKYDNRSSTHLDDNNTLNSIVNKPGVYTNVCVELEVEGLAINTILQSDNVNNIDGTDSFVAFHAAPQLSLEQMVTGQQTVIQNYDEIAASAHAFRIMKNLARDWMKKVVTNKNKIADEQIIYFYRWLTNPNSLLYDPALKKTLNIYIKKLFIQLIVKFQEFDSQIIFANFNKIILSTKINKLDEAVHRSKYTIHGILNNNLFRSIAIDIINVWHYFIWLDCHNYAGIKGKIKENGEENLASTNESEEDGDDVPEIAMNWNLSDVLPKEMACLDTFESIIIAYISGVYEFMKEMNPDRTNRSRRATPISQSIANQFGLDKTIEDVGEFARKLISGDITQQLFNRVQKINAKIPEITLTIKEHPNLDLGITGVKRINPALELIKSICKILSLDREIRDEVSSMKKHLLRLINIGEFSDKSQWHDPSISFVLPEIICKACNQTRDIDLCKDIHQRYENDINIWSCSNSECNADYDNDEIELMLIDILNRKLMGFTLQDLQCVKCHQIKIDNINDLCSCSGQFKLLIPIEHLIKHLKILNSIAQKCQMMILSHTIANINLLSSKVD